MDKLYDVIIIGAGVVGSAIAREVTEDLPTTRVLSRPASVSKETK